MACKVYVLKLVGDKIRMINTCNNEVTFFDSIKGCDRHNVYFLCGDKSVTVEKKCITVPTFTDCEDLNTQLGASTGATPQPSANLNNFESSTFWACRVSDQKTVLIEFCKIENEAGQLVSQYTDTESNAIIPNNQISALYTESKDTPIDSVCKCTTAIYTTSDPETITNVTLLTHANSSATLTGTLEGSATGISQIVMATGMGGDADLTWNGLPATDMLSGDGFEFGDATKFENIPDFSLLNNQGLLRITYTVFRCE